MMARPALKYDHQLPGLQEPKPVIENSQEYEAIESRSYADKSILHFFNYTYDIFLNLKSDNFFAGYMSDKIEMIHNIIYGLTSWNKQQLTALFKAVQSDDLRRQFTPKPTSPPNGEYYENRREKSEHGAEFVMRVYDDYLNGDFTRADLRRCDPKAEMALRNHEQKYGRVPLGLLNLPTVSERNERLVAEGKAHRTDAALAYESAVQAKARRKKGILPRAKAKPKDPNLDNGPDL